MTLRRRLIIVFAGLVALAVGLVGGFSYSATVATFNGEINRALVSAAATLAAGGMVPTTDAPAGVGAGVGSHSDADDGAGPGVGVGPGAGAGPAVGAGVDAGPAGRHGAPVGPTISLIQHIATDGAVTVVSGANKPLPIDVAQAQLASSAIGGTGRFDTRAVGGEKFRVYTLAAGSDRGAIVVGSDTDDATRVLTRVAVDTALIGLAVILAAALVGWWLAWRITRRLAALSTAAETVASTGDLTVPVETGGRDEVGRLAESMRSMLGQLAQSRDAQRRLIEDAGHELRTPITSLRTNARVLRRADELPADDRAMLLDDVDSELKELTALVNELVELATDSRPVEQAQLTQIGPLLRQVAAQVSRRSGRTVTVDADDTALVVQPHAVKRAVTNLVDNAAKFDPDGTEPIEVCSAGGVIVVSDRGPGVPVDELDRIFDRFHRSETARSRPGSGLGLAIVRHIAALHGGTATAAPRLGGGLTVTMSLRGRGDGLEPTAEPRKLPA